jgi:hypothetical protein
MKRLPKPGQTRRQGQELCYKCPVCHQGSRNKWPFEVNTRTGKGHCLKCGFVLPRDVVKEIRKVLKVQFPTGRYSRKGPPVGVDEKLQAVPDHMDRIIEERGIDPSWLTERYGVLWDGSRFCWPVGEGYWRRAPWAGMEPKVMMDPTSIGHILGEPLMDKDQVIVVTEGDYTAASIPLPWIGVGIGGHKVTEKHLDILAFHRPRLVLVMFDGGVSPAKAVRQIAMRLMDVVPVRGLPREKGPDDVPMARRVSLLLDASA